MKIGDRIYVRGYIDEIRKDTVIIRNAGGYFGTIPSEVITGELPSAQPKKRTEERTETHACDYINRKDAIEAHYEYCNKHPDAGFPVWSLKILENLPSAQPERRWIPCSERLPDDLAEVNITWVNHNPEPYYDFVKDKPATATAVYYKGKWYWYSATCTDYLAEYGTSFYNENVMDKAIEVIAWMPLPEPYAERRTDGIR